MFYQLSLEKFQQMMIDEPMSAQEIRERDMIGRQERELEGFRKAHAIANSEFTANVVAVAEACLEWLKSHLAELEREEHQETSEETFEITSEFVGESEDATIEQISEIVKSWDEYLGWELSVKRSGDEIRVYAQRQYNGRFENLPSEYIMINSESAYMKVAQKRS